MGLAIGCYGPGLALMLAAAIACVPDAQARPSFEACGPAVPLAQPIARASLRFAIPEALIHAVIAAESNYSTFAVSPKGAMGLMQLMPGTWAELRLRYGLGNDPFDRCDNVFAGTAYLRELLDRYGDPGFLAAFNAGPGRYEAYLGGRRALPPETIAYVAKISSRAIAGGVPETSIPPDPEAWRHGDLFARAQDEQAHTASGDASATAVQRPSEARPAVPREGLFVPRTEAQQ